MKRVICVLILMSVCICGNALAIDYWASGTNGPWYSSDGVELTAWGDVSNPWYGDNAYLAHGATVTYDGSLAPEIGAWVSGTYIASWSDYNLVPDFPDQDTLNLINGATLYQNGWAYVGTAAGDVGVINIDATSSWESTSIVNIGYNGHGEVNVYGNFLADYNAAGENGLFIDNQWSGADTGSGVVNVYPGGTVGNWLEIGPNGLLDIKGGTVKLVWDYWGTSWTDTLTPLLGTKIIGYGGASPVTITVDGDGNTILFAEHPLQPNPAWGETLPAGDNTLGWVLPDPNVDGDTVTCDVYILERDSGAVSTDPNIPGIGDPNFMQDALKIVDNQQQESVVHTLDSDKDYYWRIDVYNGSTTPIIGDILYFNTSNSAPVVDTGADVITWLTDGKAVVDILGQMLDDDGKPAAAIVSWEVTYEDVADAVTITTPADQLGISVDITALGWYSLTLTADDTDLQSSNVIWIGVFEDNCEASQAAGIPLLQSDFDENCVVDLNDFAVFASEWLGSTAL